MIKPYPVEYSCSLCKLRFKAEQLVIVKGRHSCPICGISREKMELVIVEGGIEPFLISLGFAIQIARQNIVRTCARISSAIIDMLAPLNKIVKLLSSRCINPMRGILKRFQNALKAPMLYLLRLSDRSLRGFIRLVGHAGNYAKTRILFPFRLIGSAVKRLYPLLRILWQPLRRAFNSIQRIGLLIIKSIQSVISWPARKLKEVPLPDWLTRSAPLLRQIFISCVYIFLYTFFVIMKAWLLVFIAGLLGIIAAFSFWGKNAWRPVYALRETPIAGEKPVELLSIQSRKWLKNQLNGNIPLLFFCTRCRMILEISELGQMPDSFLRSSPPQNYFFCPSCWRELEDLSFISMEHNPGLYEDFSQKKKNWNLAKVAGTILFIITLASCFTFIISRAGSVWSAVSGYLSFTILLILKRHIPRTVRYAVSTSPERD